jgi:hypothetical protein
MKTKVTTAAMETKTTMLKMHYRQAAKTYKSSLLPITLYSPKEGAAE